MTPAEMEALATSLVPDGVEITLSRQGLPSLGAPSGWDETLCIWTVYARGSKKFTQAEAFWDGKLAGIGATVDTKENTGEFLLKYLFSDPVGEIHASFTKLADGTTDMSADIYAGDTD